MKQSSSHAALVKGITISRKKAEMALEKMRELVLRAGVAVAPTAGLGLH